jgi:hypothetical protein
MSVGQDLLDVPFPQMIYSMAMAIAKGQTALDLNSLNTLKLLAATKFDWLPEVTETLYPKPITISGGDQLQGANPQIGKTVTGVAVDVEVPNFTKLTLLQAGFNPTFYQFVNSTIEVKMSISSTTSSESSLSVSVGVTASANFCFGSATVSSHVNYKTANKYSYSVTGSSTLSTTLNPVPPPTRVQPRFILVDATNPAHVVISQQ